MMPSVSSIACFFSGTLSMPDTSSYTHSGLNVFPECLLLKGSMNLYTRKDVNVTRYIMQGVIIALHNDVLMPVSPCTLLVDQS